MSVDGLSVAAVVVTHNSERFLRELIASIQGQTRVPDEVIVIDDHSSDATVALARSAGWRVETATSPATDTATRIAQNFTQGLRAARDFDIAILSDHDDYWLPNRLEHQAQEFLVHPDAWMLASDGRIMNSENTLRDTFPVPPDWEKMSRAKRLRYALRHSIATGGACAVRPAVLLDPENKAVPVPEGWLHDRWWSLAAVATDALQIDSQTVIEYRVQGDQQVGLERGRQADSLPRPQLRDVAKLRSIARLVTGM